MKTNYFTRYETKKRSWFANVVMQDDKIIQVK